MVTITTALTILAANFFTTELMTHYRGTSNNKKNYNGNTDSNIKDVNTTSNSNNVNITSNSNNVNMTSNNIKDVNTASNSNDATPLATTSTTSTPPETF